MKTKSVEQQTIASLLNGGWAYGGHKLTQNCFTDGRYRRIYTTIVEMEKAGDKVDLFTVADRTGLDLDEFRMGGSAKACDGYADMLLDACLQREIRAAATKIHGLEGTGAEQLSAAMASLTALEGQAGTMGLQLADYVTDWWADLGSRAHDNDWIKTGYVDVDRRLGGMRGGDLVILAGRPAMGKTAMALNIAMNCGAPTAIFSLEMQAAGLLDRMTATLAKVPMGKIREGMLSEEEWTRVTEASVMLRQLPIFLDDTGGLTIEDIHARARTIKAKHGLELVVVDYLQLIRGGDATYERVTHISQQAKRMAKDLNVPVLMLAQLSRRCEERTDKRPIASDLRDSGSIEQDADVIAFIYRDEVYNDVSNHQGYAELIFRKVRQGCIGTDWFKFDGELQEFRSTDRPMIEATPKQDWGKPFGSGKRS